jgi:hypothetical protein
VVFLTSGETPVAQRLAVVPLICEPRADADRECRDECRRNRRKPCARRHFFRTAPRSAIDAALSHACRHRVLQSRQTTLARSTHPLSPCSGCTTWRAVGNSTGVSARRIEARKACQRAASAEGRRFSGERSILKAWPTSTLRPEPVSAALICAKCTGGNRARCGRKPRDGADPKLTRANKRRGMQACQSTSARCRSH